MLGLALSGTKKRLEDKLARVEIRRQELEGLLRIAKGRVRIGTFTFDPITMTVGLRVIEPSIRVEYMDNMVIVTADRELTESEYNAVTAKLGFVLNRT